MKTVNQKSAEDAQYDIFRKMSAEESIKLASSFYRFGRMLNTLGDNYDGTRRIIKKSRRNSRRT
jgi:hypothetical protein